jgi:aminoglycoside phosphotransferase (APT) family kinase protein
LRRVLGALDALARAMTPPPIEAPTVAERFGHAFKGWSKLAAAFEEGSDDLADLDPWVRRHLGTLVESEESWGEAAAGDTLAHGDIRADNLLIAEGRVVVVDWPWACTAAPWFDLLAMLPSVRLEGGPPPEEIFDGHPLVRDAAPGAVTAVVAAITGYLVHSGRLPPPPGLPTLRDFQAAQGRVALDWLRVRMQRR